MKGFTISILLIVTLFLCLAGTVGAVDADMPNIIVKAVNEKPTVTAGEETKIDIPILNNSANYAFDVRVTIQNDINSLPFSLEQFISSVDVGRVAPMNGTTASFSVKIPEDIEPQLFKLELIFTYKDMTGTPLQTTESCYIQVENPNYEYPEEKKYFEITNIILPEKILPGDEFDAVVKFNRLSEGTIPQIEVTLGADAFMFAFDTASKTVKLDETDSVTFRLFAGENIASGKTLITATGVISSGKAHQETRFEAIANVEPADIVSPCLSIQVSSPHQITAGDEVTVSVDVTNSGDVDLENVIVSIGEQAQLLNKTPISQNIGALKAGQTVTKTFTYICAQGADGYLPIEATATAKYQDRGTYSDISSQSWGGFYINTAPSAYFEITNITLPEKVTDKTGDFTLSFDIIARNADAENISFLAELPSGVINKSPTVFNIDKMAQDEGITKTITLCATQSTYQGYCPIKISVLENGSEVNSQYSGFVYEDTEKQEGSSDNDVPVVIISKYDFGGDSVNGGATFPLTLEFKNTSKTTSVKDLKITIYADEAAAFSPAASSNTYFIERLGPGQSATWVIDLQVKNDITPKSYGLNISIDYKSESGVSASESEKLSIPVKQEMRFNISELPFLMDISTNEDAIINLNCANLGKSPVYNLMIKVTGEGFSASQYEIFAGNIEAGRSYSGYIYLTPYTEGYIEGNINYSYEDTDGNIYTHDQPFGFGVYAAQSSMGYVDIPMDPGFMGEEPEVLYEEENIFDKIYSVFTDEEPAISPTWFKIFVCALPLIIIIVLIAVIIKKRRQRRDAEDEDL